MVDLQNVVKSTDFSQFGHAAAPPGVFFHGSQNFLAKWQNELRTISKNMPVTQTCSASAAHVHHTAALSFASTIDPVSCGLLWTLLSETRLPLCHLHYFSLSLSLCCRLGLSCMSLGQSVSESVSLVPPVRCACACACLHSSPKPRRATAAVTAGMPVWQQQQQQQQ